MSKEEDFLKKLWKSDEGGLFSGAAKFWDQIQLDYPNKLKKNGGKLTKEAVYAFVKAQPESQRDKPLKKKHRVWATIKAPYVGATYQAKDFLPNQQEIQQYILIKLL